MEVAGILFPLITIIKIISIKNRVIRGRSKFLSWGIMSRNRRVFKVNCAKSCVLSI